MARYRGSKCKLCRREGTKLFLKGQRCHTEKCSFNKRPYAPGEHGNTGRRKQSEYGTQLREKQKTKRIYNVLEKQFRNYFKKADKMKGITGENLLQLLELRLDNVVYRLGFGRSRTEARQVVRHDHIMVNGSKVNIPSYEVKAGDVIEIKADNKDMERFKDVLAVTESKPVPSWLEADKKKLNGKVVSIPNREEIDIPVNETLIVELYSK